MITIIVPVYNGRSHIEKCIRSICGQTSDLFELLLIDDGSTDGTAQICDDIVKSDRHIRVIHQANAGVSSARNTGIKEARGDWLMFVDSDDELAPSALEYLFSLTNDNIDAVCGGIVSGRSFGAAGSDSRVPEHKTISDNGALLSLVLRDPTRWLTCHGWLLRTDILRKHSIVFNSDLTLGEDGEMIIRFLLHSRSTVLSNKIVYQYSINAGSTIHRWKSGISEKYIQTIAEVQKSVSNNHEGFAAYTLTHLLLILTHDTFHRGNPLGFSAKLKECSRLLDMDIFDRAFRNADLKVFGFARRATLLCLKHRILIPAWLAVRVRQLQNTARSS